MKIGSKLVIGFLIVILLIALAGYTSTNASQKALQKSIGENTVMLAQETLDKIDRDIYDRIERWESYAYTNPRLKETVVASNQEFGKMDNIQNYIDEKDKAWVSAPKKEITPFMEEIIDNELSQRLEERIFFYEKEHGYRVFGEVFVTNKYGANVAQTGKTTDYYQADEEWWQNAKRDGLYITDVEYDRSAEVYSTDIGIRVDDEDGNFLGVMKVVLNIEEVINIIKEVEVTEEYETTRSIELITNRGEIIYDSEGGYEIFEDLPEEVFLHFLEGDTGYLVMEEPGEDEEFLAYVHSKGYKDFKGLGWILVVEQETEEIFAPVIKLKNTMIVISLAVTIFAVLIGISISRSISDPITKLRDAAIEIGKGKLDTKMEIESEDDIGELASTFSQMVKDLKAARNKLKRHEHELEDTVKERTKELNVKIKELEDSKAATLNILEDIEESRTKLVQTQEELKKHVEKLELMDKKKNEFISITAHELKTPLTSIHGFSDLLQDPAIANDLEKRNKYLKIIGEDTQRLGKLITDILDLSRIDLGTMRFNYKKVDVHQLIEQLKRQMDILIKKKKIKSLYNVDGKLSYAILDEGRMIQILSNFLTNAVKYTPKNGEITVAATKEGENVKFSVIDTGIGIPKEEQDKIFDRFYQIDSSYTRKVGGSGLGLAICREITAAMGGKIELESEMGKGAKFSVIFPIERKNT